MPRNVNGYPTTRGGGSPAPGWRPGDFRPTPPPGHFDPFYDWYFKQPFGDLREINKLREHLREVPFQAIKKQFRRTPIGGVLWDIWKRTQGEWFPGRILHDPDPASWSRSNFAGCATPQFYSDVYCGTPCAICEQDSGTVTKLTATEAAALFTFARWGVTTPGKINNVDTWTRVPGGTTYVVPGAGPITIKGREPKTREKTQREPPQCKPGSTVSFVMTGIGMNKEQCEVRFGGKKERKFSVSIAGTAIGKLIGSITEAIDLFECMYEALPAKAKPKTKPRGPHNRMDIVFRFFESATLEEGNAWLTAMIKCFVQEQIEDAFFARIGKIGADAAASNPFYVRPVGFQTGNWAWQELFSDASRVKGQLPEII